MKVVHIQICDEHIQYAETFANTAQSVSQCDTILLKFSICIYSHGKNY